MRITALAVLPVALLSGTALAQGEPEAPPPVRDMDAVVDVLSSISDPIQEAYALVLFDDPYASGTLELSFEIQPDGRVVNIEVTGTQGLEEVIDVIEEELLLLDFGPCAEQLENIPVSAPLLLMPPSDSGAEGTEWH